MRVRVLGSAAGGGLPQWNCACANCSAARAGRLPARTVASIVVSGDGERWVLVNASCDVSRQLAAAPCLQPHEGRETPIAAVLFTDANIDHVAGLLEFRQADALAVYSTDVVRRVLGENPMFAQCARGERRWKTFAAGAGASVDVAEAPGLRVFAIDVPGLLPSYAGGERTNGAAVAYVFEHASARLIYAPIFLSLLGELARELADADAAFLDGTCWTNRELIELGLGTRTSLEMGHQPMWGSDGSLHVARSSNAKHRYYTHVNNSNPVVDPDSWASRTLREAGFAVAHDGLEITL